VTVGDLIREVKSGATGSGRTLDDYCRNFRKLVAEIFEIDGGTEKYDYQKGGRQAWLEKVDGVKLCDITPELIQKWKVSFVRRAGTSGPRQAGISEQD
jgi:hypothetical protein